MSQPSWLRDRGTLLQIAYGVGLGLITLALAWVAYRAMYSVFDVPDDDGYVLMSLRKYNDGALYSDVYSQYGPGLYVLLGSVLRAVGVALTNDGARAVNLFLWLSSTLLVGLSLLRLTRKFTVSAAGLLVAFLVLKVDVNEPLHPGATIGFLLIATVAVAVFLLPSRPRAALAAVGALAAALLSIKVNVGIFALFSVAVACFATVPALRRHLALRVVLCELFFAIPFALLSEHLGDADTLRFAGMVAVGAAGIGLISFRLAAARIPDMRAVVAGIVGAAAVIALVAIVPMIGGTSPHDLVDGWALRPAKTPGIQWVPLLVHHLAWLVAAAGLLGAVAVLLLRDRRPGTGVRALLGAGRIVVGLAIWAVMVAPIFELPVDLTQGVVIGAPFLWVAMLDPRGSSPETSFLRILIPALASLQFLHAYPMPGSQAVWGAFLLVVVGGICVADGAEELSLAGMSWRPSFAGWSALAAIPVVVFGAWLCLKPLRSEVRLARDNYDAGVSIDVPGARDIHVSEPQALQLEEITAGLRASCDTFLTLPGMNSLNIFSGEEPPVEMPGPWPFFFTADEQRQIVDEVRTIPRFCVVYKPDLLAFWAGYSDNDVPDRPLVRYVEEDFRPLHNYSGYYLMVRKQPLPGEKLPAGDGEVPPPPSEAVPPPAGA
jgi:hypothetical protein